MANRVYGVFSRNKLPRNKYGLLFDQYNLTTANSVFGGYEAADQVGGSMVEISDMFGATATEDGVHGLVPAPLAGDNTKFLQGTGAWIDIPAYRWMSEFPTTPGLEKSGLTVNGNLNVADTLSTMNLKVEGMAEFWTLIIDQVKANGGQVIVSPSTFHVDYVGDVVYHHINEPEIVEIFNARKDIYNMFLAAGVVDLKCRRLWTKNDDGSKRTENKVEAGDMLRCRSFNIAEGIYRNVSNNDFWSFVVETGPNPNKEDDPTVFVDDDGNENSGFWIDLVYALRLSNGNNLPLGTLLKNDGSFILPEGYSDIEDALELKKVSYKTLTGSEDVEREVFDNEEWKDIQKKVIKIRGIDSSLNRITGVESDNSLEDNSEFLSQAAQQLEFIVSGTLEDNADEGDLSSLILNGTYDSDGDGIEDDEYALYQSGIISNTVLSPRGAVGEIEPEFGLSIEKIRQNSLVISKDVVLEKNFVAAEDLYDSDGIKVYDKGDTVLSGITTGADWRLFDNLDSDIVKEFDPVTGDETIPENENEINNFTDNTAGGVDRDSDSSMNKDYSSLEEWLFGYGVFSVGEGDELSALGHLYDSNRQNAIVISSTAPIDPELVPPCIAQYSNIDSFGESISKYRMTSIAANGNEFFGSFLVNYEGTYIDVDERINLLIKDLETGLERVGIHLDGENSTITLVGSVDIRQHSDDSYDTVGVYDNFNTKRVEILPFDIPRRSSPESSIDISKKYFEYVEDTKNATKSYINYDSWRHWYFWPFNSTMVYKYELKNYKVSFTSSVNLGYIKGGTSLDLSSLDLKVWAYTYLVGKTLVKNHGSGNNQSVSVIRYTLKRDGVVVKQSDLVSDPGTVITGTSSAEIKISCGRTFLNDYSISTSGTYTLDIKVDYTVYAYTECGTKYSNYYYSINCGLSGNIIVSLDKNLGSSEDVSQRKMTVGTNGLVFNCNNSRYFYAASDGYELKWDDAGIKIDSENGLRETKLYEVISAAKSINKKYDMVICNYTSGGYTVTLPIAAEFGVGRRMTVLAFRGLKVKTSSSDVVRVSTANNFAEASTIEFGSGSAGSLVMPKYVVELIAINGAWYITSYY